MRLIQNPWTGMPGYNCFGCCDDNPIGLHMHFYSDGDDIVSVWRANDNLMSWVDTLHGGIQAVLLDEIAGWVPFYQFQSPAVTAKMELRLKNPVRLSWPYIVLRGRVKERKRNILIVEATITAPDGTVCVTSEYTYFMMTGEQAQQMMFKESKLVGPDYTLEQVIAREIG